MRSCVFNTGSNTHLLDHTAPLASLLGVPLLVTEEETARLAKTFYPEVSCSFWPDLEFHLQEVAAEFDAWISCQYWAPHLSELLERCFHKKPQLIFCPHGQSDKGYKAQLLAPYAEQDGVLIYGDLLQEMLTELQIWDQIRSAVRIGNFRLEYHKAYADRQRAAADAHIFSMLNRSNRTLLYAPTWRDADESSSLFAQSKKLLQDLPADWNLIVKIHPLLPERDPALYCSLTHLEEQRPNMRLLVEFPLLYPILERIDAYLGDYSSVGYDALAFQMPMFFFASPHLPAARLHQCGQIIDGKENIFQCIERSLAEAGRFIPQQQALYKKAFDDCLINKSFF